MKSRVARKPIEIPAGVDVVIEGSLVTIKSAKGQLEQPLHKAVSVIMEDGHLLVKVNPALFDKPDAIAGTTRALLQNHIIGVSTGFSKKLVLVGVGYRAQKGKTNAGLDKLDLTLGFSHPVSYDAPAGITFNVPSVTEIEVLGANKQVVGQVAAEIRDFRPPEPYKGKGVRYHDEVVNLKETKK